jgi:hypothetical protein
MMRGSHAEKVRNDLEAEPKKLGFFSLNWGVYPKNLIFHQNQNTVMYEICQHKIQ